MAGVRKQPTKGGLYQAYYKDWTGKRQYLTEETAKQALKAAMAIEKEHDEIRKGYRPAPSSSDGHRKSLWSDVLKEYLAWGESQGGRGGRPWGEHHARQRRARLMWWGERLGFSILADLEGMLPRAEKALRGLQEAGRAGKTLQNYAEAIGAFCNWCEQRGYLNTDPLKGMASFDTTPLLTRRAMTQDEIVELLHIAPPERRLLYETAFVSGLRANELSKLTVAHLDIDRVGLHLDAEWTKNRKVGFQPLPRALVERLRVYSETGEARQIYERNFKKAKAKREVPKNPLFYVPSHTDRVLKIDLQTAGIPINTPKGKLDFHACRVAFINLILDQGEVTPKEAQELARHSTLDLTMNVYGRVREGRLAEAVERAGAAIFRERSVPDVYRMAVGAEQKNATLVESESCVSSFLVAAEGLEPPTRGL